MEVERLNLLVTPIVTSQRHVKSFKPYRFAEDEGDDDRISVNNDPAAAAAALRGLGIDVKDG